MNPTLLSNCMVDEDCTKMSCDTNGALAMFYGSVTFTVEPCGVRPGVKIDLAQVQENGRAILPQLVIRQTVISIGPLTIIVFLNSTDTSVNIAVRCSCTHCVVEECCVLWASVRIRQTRRKIDFNRGHQPRE